ncbi:hypothetical protein HDU96_003783, partial [Phlyctochytrium bullatum]
MRFADTVVDQRLSSIPMNYNGDILADDGELLDLSLDRAFVADEVGTIGDDDEHVRDLSTDDIESADLLRDRKGQTINGEKFNFPDYDTDKYAFISRRLNQPGDQKKVFDDWKKECNKKFPARKSKQKNRSCKRKIRSISFARGFALVAYPDVVVSWEIEGPGTCNMTILTEEWCQKAFGSKGINHPPCSCRRLLDASAHARNKKIGFQRVRSWLNLLAMEHWSLQSRRRSSCVARLEPAVKKPESLVPPLSTSPGMRTSTSTAQLLHPILTLPREVTALILVWLHPTAVIELLRVSRHFRNHFSLLPKEYRIARRQLERHCLGVLKPSKKPAYIDVAFHQLPMAYSLALISCVGFREDIIGVAFPEDASILNRKRNSQSWCAIVQWSKPFEQPKRVELLMRKALEFGLVDVSIIAWPLERPSGFSMYQLTCRFALHVAAMLDSVPLTMKLIDLAIKKNPADGPRLRPEAVSRSIYSGHRRIQTLTKVNPNTEIDEGGSTLLSLAAEFGRVDVTRLMLSHGADINVRCRTAGRSPLHLAAKLGHLDVVRVLLEQGADVDCTDSQNSTPLILAAYARKESLAIAQLLIEKGANIDARDKDGSTSLHAAVQQDQINVVRLLLESGANVDCRNKYKMTALMWAASKGLIEVAKLLVDSGAQVDARNVDGATPLSL